MATRKTKADTAKEEYEATQAAIARQKQELEKGKAQLEAMKNSIKKAKKVSRVLVQRNDAVVKAITDIAKTDLWIEDVKFINNDLILRATTEKAIRKLPGGSGFSDGEMEGYVDTYAKDVKKAIADKRNYCQSELKKVAVAFALKRDYLPTEEQMKSIVERKFDKNDEQMWELFGWYWTVALSKVVGKFDGWNDDRMYYNTISQCKVDRDGTAVRLISASTEAFFLTLWKNCEKKWRYIFNHEKTENAKGKSAEKDPLPTRKKNMKKQLEDDPTLEDLFVCPFTSQDNGQTKFDAWNSDGLTYFKNTKKHLKKNRKQRWKDIVQLEKEMLEQLRESAGKTAGSAEEERARKRRKTTTITDNVEAIDLESDEEEDYDALESNDEHE